MINWLARFGAAVRAFRRDDGGNLAVIFAVASIPMFGMAGSVIDYSRAGKVRAELQAALDNAVLAAAKTGSVATATTFFTASFTDPLAKDVSTTFMVNANGSVSGTAQASVPTSVLALLHVSSIPVSVAATAAINPAASSTSSTTTTTVTTPVTTAVCILVLDATASQALLVNSGAKINAPNCEIDVSSTASPAAMINNSGTTLNVAEICIKGTSVTQNGGTNPVVKTGCAAIGDPFAGKLPQVAVGSCNHTNQVYDGTTVTVSPGVYCGSTNFNGSPAITFKPGLYVIDGGTMTINADATVSGNGVTFYFVDQNSKIQFNGGISGKLSAPTSGTYANILMYEAPGLAQSPFVFDGTKGENLQGLVYLPSRQVTFNSVSSVTSEKITMVVSTLILDSTNFAFTTSAETMQRTVGSTTTSSTTTTVTDVPGAYLAN